MKIVVAASAIALALVFGASTSQAQVQEQEGAGRLSELVVRAMPIGDIFQSFIDADERWPLNERASRLEPAQLGCVRQRLSTAGFREQRHTEALAFAKRHPELIGPSVRVLEEGGADLFSALVRAGAEQSRTGRKVDFNRVAADFRPTQLAAFVELTSDEKHRALRELIGIDDAVSIQHSPDQNKERGRNKGMVMGVKLMLGAMEHCKVPLTAIQ